MKKKTIINLNVVLFVLEIYRMVEHIVVFDVLDLYGKSTFWSCVIDLLRCPMRLIGHRNRVIISLVMTAILWIEKKYLLDKLSAMGVSEKVCTGIEKFSILSWVNTAAFVFFLFLAIQ